MRKLVLLSFCLLVLAVGSAWADEIDITTSSPGQWVLSAGGIGSSTLTSFTYGFTNYGSPDTGISYNFITGFFFTYQTGVLTGVDSTGYHFGPGGGVCVSDGPFCSGSTLLFLGTFTGASLVQTSPNHATFSAAFVTGNVNPGLLIALGIADPNTAVDGSVGSSMSGNFTLNGSGRTSGITANLSQSQVVPEPASMALLGTGLLGLGSFVRRKFVV